MRVPALLVSCLLASGCGPFVYKIDVQQGNYVTQDMVAKLKPGMTKAEVRQALGTPLLTDVFHADRWDYPFTSVKGHRAEDGKRLTIIFKEDKLVSFTGTAHPPLPPPVAATSAAAPAAEPPLPETRTSPPPRPTPPAPPPKR